MAFDRGRALCSHRRERALGAASGDRFAQGPCGAARSSKLSGDLLVAFALVTGLDKLGNFGVFEQTHFSPFLGDSLWLCGAVRVLWRLSPSSGGAASPIA